GWGLIQFSLRVEKNRSTRFIHEADVGVKWML
ncbi:hypothetical protein Pgy4_40687, partial [Pseudomonas savastanoi pv. glycinea str. race 4]